MIRELLARLGAVARGEYLDGGVIESHPHPAGPCVGCQACYQSLDAGTTNFVVCAQCGCAWGAKCFPRSGSEL